MFVFIWFSLYSYSSLPFFFKYVPSHKIDEPSHGFGDGALKRSRSFSLFLFIGILPFVILKRRNCLTFRFHMVWLGLYLYFFNFTLRFVFFVSLHEI